MDCNFGWQDTEGCKGCVDGSGCRHSIKDDAFDMQESIVNEIVCREAYPAHGLDDVPELWRLHDRLESLLDQS